jgi:hypothetical protein
MLGVIQRYVLHRVRPGSFLTAIITNDLQEAVGHADDETLSNIPAFVAYFYNEAPQACWGSQEKMDRWLENKDEL